MVAPIEVPDATSDPMGYKEALLDLVGDHDPLGIMGRTVGSVRALSDGIDERRLYASPEPGEWSVAAVTAHLFDVDVVYGFRWRLALTTDRPTYPGYDEQAWAALEHPPFALLLAAWDGLRASNVALLRSLSVEAWSRTGVHAEQGPETIDEMARKVAGHDLAHLNQLERALDAAS